VEGVTLEADETFIGRKAGTKLYKDVSEKQIVFTLVERDGRARSTHIPNVRSETLREAIVANASLKAIS